MMTFVKKVFQWRWISILLLAIISNTLINAILDFKYQRPLVSFSYEEYLNALLSSVILLEGTRWISKKINDKLPWEKGVTRRLLTQLGLQLLFIIVLTNILVISITLLVGGGFYTFDDLMIINLSVVSVTFFFSIIDVGIYFFYHWQTLKAQPRVENKVKPIKISLGKVQYLIPQNDIRCVFFESRSVFVLTKEGRKLVYTRSLDVLMKQLDPSQFFKANRQNILSHSVVKAIKPLPHGKIEVNLAPHVGQPDAIIVSRPRAANFRKWIKSQTAS